MSLQNHLAELRRRHRAVDDQIQELGVSPGVPDVRLHELKRLKLNLKDEIASIERDAPGALKRAA